MMIEKLLEPDANPAGGDGELVQRWITELEDARRREQKYRAEARDLVEMYEGGKVADAPFNILFSNTETLAPAVYNSTPRPRVQQRFKDDAPLAKAASDVTKRTLEYLIDPNRDCAPFDELMKQAVLEALVVGRGVTELDYEPTISTDTAGGETVTAEYVVGREVPWDRFLHGYAKKWRNVPWIAFEYFMTREELIQNFGPEIGASVTVEGEKKDSETGEREDDPTIAKQKVAHVYKIWDKDTRTVLFVSPNYKQGPLKITPDPLGLAGFFPCPRPLGFVQKINTLVPVPPYKLYKRQARELNRVTERIDRLVEALKNRGMYDKTVEGIDKVLDAEDNTLIAADNVAAALAQGNSLEKAIWLFPIEKLVPVLQQLYIQREQVKRVIYEITGIADIMRGSTQASETLGAQEIKNQWGTLRLKRTQKEVARYARDCLRIMAEIAVTRFSPQTLKQMTALPFPMEEEKQRAAQALAEAQAAGMPSPPELVQQVQSPSWEQLSALLQNDLQRSYQIDIETNSTVDAEATEDKQDIAELLNAIAQFLNGVAPLIEQGVMPFDIAKGMLLTIVRRYQFGPELEDQLIKMMPPQPKADPKVEAAKLQAQIDQQMAQFDMQAKQMDLQAKERQAQIDATKAMMELQLAEREHQLKMEEMSRKALFDAAAHQQKMQQMRMQAQTQAQAPRPTTKSAK